MHYTTLHNCTQLYKTLQNREKTSENVTQRLKIKNLTTQYNTLHKTYIYKLYNNIQNFTTFYNICKSIQLVQNSTFFAKHYETIQQLYTTTPNNTTMCNTLLNSTQVYKTKQNSKQLYKIQQNFTILYINTQLYTTLHDFVHVTQFSQTIRHVTNLFPCLQKVYKTLHTRTSQNFTKLYNLYTTSTNFTKQTKQIYITFQHCTQLFTSPQKPSKNTKKTKHNFTHLYKTLHLFIELCKIFFKSKSKLYTILHNFTKLYKHFTQLNKTLHNFTNLNTTSQNFTNKRNFTSLYKHVTSLYNNCTQLYKNKSITLYQILQNFTYLYTTLHNFTKLYKTLQQFPQFYKTTHNFRNLYKIAQNSTNLYQTIQHFTHLYKALQNYPKTFSNFPTFSKTFRNFPKLSATLQNLTQLTKLYRPYTFSKPYTTSQNSTQHLQHFTQLYKIVHNFAKLYSCSILNKNFAKLADLLQPFHKQKKYTQLFSKQTTTYRIVQHSTQLYNKNYTKLDRTLQHVFSGRTLKTYTQLYTLLPNSTTRCTTTSHNFTNSSKLYKTIPTSSQLYNTLHNFYCTKLYKNSTTFEKSTNLIITFLKIRQHYTNHNKTLQKQFNKTSRTCLKQNKTIHIFTIFTQLYKTLQ